MRLRDACLNVTPAANSACEDSLARIITIVKEKCANVPHERVLFSLSSWFESRLLPARQQVAQEIANFAKVKRSRASRLRSLSSSRKMTHVHRDIFLSLFQIASPY